jgi:hypothetical protein
MVKSVNSILKRKRKSEDDASKAPKEPVERKKRGANPAFAERKKRQKARAFTAVKTGVIKLCRDDDMYQLLQECVSRSSVIACEASLLTSFHVTRLLEGGIALPVMDYTFFNQCVSSIANLGTNRSCEGRNAALHETLQLVQTMQPEDYQPIGRLSCMTQMLVMIAQQAQENFAVSTTRTLKSRLARWYRLKIKQHSQQTGTTYFTANESNIIKSILSVMTRASTEEPYSVAGLINAYTRFQNGQYPVPPAEMAWMQSLCDEVRGRIGPLPLDIKKQPHVYLPFLHEMLRDLETYNQTQILEQKDEKPVKLFTVLPQKKIRPLNIKINNTVLADMHRYLKNGVHLEGRDLWDYYFNTARVTKSERKEFEEFMVTDGLSATLIVSRPKQAAEEVEDAKASKQRDLERAQRLFEEADRVVAVDPGRNPILTAVVHNQAAMDSLQEHSPNNVKHEVLTWGKKQFYQEAGYTHRSKVTKLWSNKATVIATFNQEVQTAKTSHLDVLRSHTRHVLANLRTVMAFYNTQRFKRLRWKTYISKQKAYEKLVAALKGDSKNPLIVWGNANFPSAGRGSPAVPTTTLFKKVASRLNTVDEDEFRTSKLAACCHREMQGLLQEDGTRSWSLRVCQNNACPRSVWDRNTSAAISILALFLHRVQGRGRLQAFRRGNAVDEADVMDVEVVAVE